MDGIVQVVAHSPQAPATDMLGDSAQRREQAVKRRTRQAELLRRQGGAEVRIGRVAVYETLHRKNASGAMSSPSSCLAALGRLRPVTKSSVLRAMLPASPDRISPT